MTQIPAQILGCMSLINALPCWKVGVGDSVGSSFRLAFGRKLSRLVPRMVEHRIIQEYQDYGEATLLVWCAWRLDSESRPLTSSDDAAEGIERGLSELVGATVEGVEVLVPAWDLNVSFSNKLHLKVFCDHVPGDPSIEVNWELFRDDVSLHVGPGAKYKVEKPEALAMLPG